MSDPSAPEPTMEEILASIRRIISEDDAPADEHAEPAEADAGEPLRFEAAEEREDVLELIHPIEPEPHRPEPVETSGDIDHSLQSKPEAPRMQDDDERLVGERSATAAASAFGRLSAAVAMPEHGRSLEDVTKDLLKPLLKTWLDEHLPRIVENKVAEEVERLSRGRVR